VFPHREARLGPALPLTTAGGLIGWRPRLVTRRGAHPLDGALPRRAEPWTHRCHGRVGATATPPGCSDASSGRSRPIDDCDCCHRGVRLGRRLVLLPLSPCPPVPLSAARAGWSLECWPSTVERWGWTASVPGEVEGAWVADCGTLPAAAVLAHAAETAQVPLPVLAPAPPPAVRGGAGGRNEGRPSRATSRRASPTSDFLLRARSADAQAHGPSITGRWGCVEQRATPHPRDDTTGEEATSIPASRARPRRRSQGHTSTGHRARGPVGRALRLLPSGGARCKTRPVQHGSPAQNRAHGRSEPQGGDARGAAGWALTASASGDAQGSHGCHVRIPLLSTPGPTGTATPRRRPTRKPTTAPGAGLARPAQA